MSVFTNILANNLCGGSARKLIAGWWYSILVLSLLLTIMSLWVISNRTAAEGFSSIWAAIMMIMLSVGGTMIMRRFHNSIAVGFFLGSIVATSQLFFLLFLIYLGYAGDRRAIRSEAGEENFMAFICFVQSILLCSFAAILGAHRTEILDRSQPIRNQMSGEFSATSDYQGSAADGSAQYKSPNIN